MATKSKPRLPDSWGRGGSRGRSAADKWRGYDVILQYDEVSAEPPAALAGCWRAVVRLAMRGDARARPIIIALRALERRWMRERRWRRGWAW
jgi:hypothetical protein